MTGPCQRRNSAGTSLRRLLLRYRGAEVIEKALAEMLPELEKEGQRVATMVPDGMSGYTFP